MESARLALHLDFHGDIGGLERFTDRLTGPAFGFYRGPKFTLTFEKKGPNVASKRPKAWSDGGTPDGAMTRRWGAQPFAGFSDDLLYFCVPRENS